MEGDEDNVVTDLTDTGEPKIPSVVTPDTKSSQKNQPFFTLIDPENTVVNRILKMKDTNEDTEEGKTSAQGETDNETKNNPPPGPRTKSSSINKDFGELLENLFEEIDLNEERPHEILQGLDMQGIKSWNSFIRMTEDDIQKMVRPLARSKPVPLSNHSITMLGYLKQMIWEQIEAKEPRAKDISFYNKEDFDSYIDDMNLKKRKKVSYSVSTTGLPAFTPTTSKSSGEKKYEAWTRAIGKRSKSSFNVLKQDDHYRVWRTAFDAELAHQQMSHTIDPSFDPTVLTCSFEKIMWGEQQSYLWTILLHVFQNPLGKSCTSDHTQDKDARQAFLDHHELQEQSPARAFSTGIYLTALREMSITTHQGTRVDFIATWFELLRQLNEVSEEPLGYGLTKGLLLTAVTGDTKLRELFTELKETTNKDADLENLKTFLLQKAALYDNHDVYVKTRSPTTRAASTHSLHDISTDASSLDLLIQRAHRGKPPNPDARLPDALFESLEPQDRSAWRQLPESTRIKLVRLIQAKPPPSSPDRRIYFNDSTSSSPGDNATARSDLTDATAILDGLKQLLVNATHGSSHSSPPNTRPPGSGTILKSPSKASTPSKASSSTSSKKSEIDPGHIASILADKPVDLFDRAGNHYGHINMKFHRWYTEQDAQTDACTTPSMPHQARTYKVSKAATDSIALIDRGANGCVAGDDCRWIGGPVCPRNVSITGIDNHQLTGIPVGTVGSFAMSNRGPVICIFNEVAYTGKHRSILSSFQLEYYGNDVCDKNPAVGGKGSISTPDGYTFPLSFSGGLAYIKMRPYTDTEYNTLPHVIMSSDKEWDPTVYDRDVNPNDYLELPDLLEQLPDKNYNTHGEYIGIPEEFEKNGTVQFTELVDNPELQLPDFDSHETEDDRDVIDFRFWVELDEYIHNEVIARCIKVSQDIAHRLEVHDMDVETEDRKATITPRIHTPDERDYQALKPHFSWIPTRLIKETFKHSTQYGYMPTSPDGNLFKRWHAPNPAMNVFRLQDDLLTDKVYSDTKAIDGNHSAAQVFFGRCSHIIHVEPISNTFPFIKGLQNFVRKWGAPNRLLGDSAGNQQSKRVMDYLRLLWIGSWCSEPYYKHQNMCERRYQTFKRIVNRTMDRTNTPPHLWFLCMKYVAYVLNRVSDPSLNMRQPLFVATGRIGDISAINEILTHNRQTKRVVATLKQYKCLLAAAAA